MNRRRIAKALRELADALEAAPSERGPEPEPAATTTPEQRRARRERVYRRAGILPRPTVEE